MAQLQDDEKDEKKQADAPLMADLANGDMSIIEKEIESQPLVSDKRSLQLLQNEFKDHKNFARQMSALINEERHASYRQMRRDGNCFYRAFLLGLFETIEATQDSQLLRKVSETVMSSLHRLLKFGFESYTLEDFYEQFLDELQFYQRKLESGNPNYKAQDNMGDTAIVRMANPNIAQYLIFWARMMASLYMRENQKEYEMFVPQHKGGFGAWLKSDVEALKAEADHLQTVALSKAMDVPITIYCLENVPKGGPQKVDTIANRKSCFDVLFRPGHYDVLYRKMKGGNDDENKDEQQQQMNSNDKDNDENDNDQQQQDTSDDKDTNKDKDNETDIFVSNALPNNGNTKV